MSKSEESMKEVWSCMEAACSAAGGAERRARAAPAAAAAKARLLHLQLASRPRPPGDGDGDDDALTERQVASVRDYLGQCGESLRQMVAEHRNMHPAISKFGKSIDRAFRPDIMPAAPRDEAFSAPRNRDDLNRSIVLHLHRNGLKDVAETFAREADVGAPEITKEMTALQDVVDAMKRRDPLPALAWLQSRADPADHSELTFKLHRLVFRNLTYSHGYVAAIDYAQQHFPQFANEHKNELQRTMCLLVYESGLLPLSYITLNDEILWNDGLASFLKEAAAVLDFPAVSPIETAIEAGVAAVPTLLDIHEKLLQTHGNHSWSTREELPISMAKTDHSVISCPILRQQTTNENPPMRLLCGHVISKDALDKLCRNSRLKCPYCPMDQKRSDARIIYI